MMAFLAFAASPKKLSLRWNLWQQKQAFKKILSPLRKSPKSPPKHDPTIRSNNGGGGGGGGEGKHQFLFKQLILLLSFLLFFLTYMNIDIMAGFNVNLLFVSRSFNFIKDILPRTERATQMLPPISCWILSMNHLVLTLLRTFFLRT